MGCRVFDFVKYKNEKMDDMEKLVIENEELKNTNDEKDEEIKKLKRWLKLASIGVVSITALSALIIVVLSKENTDLRNENVELNNKNTDLIKENIDLREKLDQIKSIINNFKDKMPKEGFRIHHPSNKKIIYSTGTDIMNMDEIDVTVNFHNEIQEFLENFNID